jgi:hypothetical protein
VTGGDLSAPARSALAESLALLLLQRLHVEAVTSTTLRERAGLAAEQQLAGCDASACMAELADALGARYVVFSRIVSLGDDRVLRTEVFDHRSARAVALATVRGGSEGDLAPRLPELVEGLIGVSAGALPVRQTALELSVPTVRRWSPLVAHGLIASGVGLGGLLIGAGSVLLINEHLSEINVAAAAYSEESTADNAAHVVEKRGLFPDVVLVAGGCAGFAAMLSGALAVVVGGSQAALGALSGPSDTESP